MKVKSYYLLLAFVAGMALQMAITFIFDDEKYCAENVYIEALDSVVNSYEDLQNKYDSMIDGVSVDILKDTVKIQYKYDTIKERIPYMCYDSLVYTCLKGTEQL